MEMELFSNVVSEEETVEVDAENDNFGIEGERCGICMDIVIDRGVLDCCQHWFCFVCIDNWSSITNLCPLCQNEFQLITCVPVYDTIGSSKADEDSESRDDDWYVEGQNSTLSFPSYYIDENAVTCLDGDGCKIRSGSVTFEESSTLDTSIACDSCDIWYHAFCVGFDPEGICVDSWLCPRCLGHEVRHKSNSHDICGIGTQLDPGKAGHLLLNTFSGKVSVSVADAGETAVVVSRIDGELVKDSTGNCSHIGDAATNPEIEQSARSPDQEIPLDPGINDALLDTSFPSVNPQKSVVKIEPDECESIMCWNLGSSTGSNLCEDDETKMSGKKSLCNARDRSISKNESSEDVKADIAHKPGEKRKRADYGFQTNDEDKITGGSSTKKAKSLRGTKRTSLNGQTHMCASDERQKANRQIESPVNQTLGNVPSKKTSSVDIMSLVQGTEFRTVKRSVRQKETEKGTEVPQTAARVRVKKIMRRPNVDKDADDVVQRLRKEIREAVRKKSTGEVGKGLDSNLLAAFRAAVVESDAGSVKKPSPAVLKAKKLLQKSKTRENLTKKIYASSNGKRKRAWDRDCEVEFWKHRCLTTSKPEKIETLRSVLKLLRKSPEANTSEKNSVEEAKAPILSRLFLADASVFPRKDDIKPLSVLIAGGASKQNEECSAGEKNIEPCPDNSMDRSLESNNNISSADDKKSKSGFASGKNGIASGRILSNKHANKFSGSTKVTAKSLDIKVDKRKWALEVLARKAAANSTSSVHQEQNNSELKGNYPLLAQLPTDMRPKPASIGHNKIPMSVRQTQLYRLTEHFLKMENLSSIRRTAATELAVADAINIEKQVAVRSSIKNVYLNLCAQEIRNRSNCCVSTIHAESASSTPLSVPTEGPLAVPNEDGQSSVPSLDSETEAALRTAGLLSDSPPSSPPHNDENCHANGSSSVEGEEQGTENILEMDSHPDLDIYGDFEYDLDEEDYIGASAIQASKSQAEDGESKVKVIFSTLCTTKADKAPEAEEQVLRESGVELSSASLFGSINNDGNGSLAVVDANSEPLATENSCVGEGEELSLVECEALYGPDEEPLVEKLPELALVENLAPPSVNRTEVKKSEESSTSHHDTASERKSSPFSQAVEHGQDEKKNNPKVDKKSCHADSVLKKVEAYIKEHLRPLCKSGVITVEQYRWAVGKTTDKVLKYHSKSKNANFLIKEGEKVKKLAEQYVEAAKLKENK